MATHKKLEDAVEFELINDFGEYKVSLYFKENWSETDLYNRGLITSEDSLSDIVQEVEDALKEYYGVE